MPSPRAAGRWALAAAVLALALGVWYFASSRGNTARLAVVPAGAGSAEEEALVAAVRTEVGPGNLVESARAAYLLKITVRPPAAQSGVTVSLVEPATGRERWREDFYAQNLADSAALGTLARSIARDVESALGTAR